MQVAAGGRPVRAHFVHPSLAGAASRGVEQPLEVCSLPFSDHFDGTVVTVAHPTAQAEVARLAHYEIPEADSLDVAVDECVKAL
jgi:hypothetical protein